jgi:hypothetical protein
MKLQTVWSRIAAVRALTFKASSGGSTGWTGSGVGTVDVSRTASDVLVYSESGTWTASGGKQLSFTNVYRWTLLSETIRLEHLRLGTENPVHLFDLAVIGDSRLASVDPHV